MLKLQSIGHIIPIIVLKVLKAYCKYLILLDVKLLAYDKISNHGNVISLVRLHVHDTLCSYTEYCNMTHRPFCNSRQLLWTVQHALPTCAPYTRPVNVKWVCSTWESLWSFKYTRLVLGRYEVWRHCTLHDVIQLYYTSSLHIACGFGVLKTWFNRTARSD